MKNVIARTVDENDKGWLDERRLKADISRVSAGKRGDGICAD